MKQILLKIGIKPALSPEAASWVRRWVIFTLAASFLITVVDAVLLQKKTGFLTGGFLSDFYLHNTRALLGFAVSSIICDSGILGILVLVTFFLFRHWNARVRLWELLVFSVALSPLLFLDLVKYRLEIYIGDIFKLLFLFDLTGKNFREFLAVSYSQVLILLLFVAVLTVTLIFIARRIKDETADVIPQFSVSGIMLLSPLFLLLFSMLYSTAVRLGSEQLDYVLRRKPSGIIMGFVVNRLSDFDGDGFGLLAKPADPDSLNPDIYPYAIDIPGNGVDENGVGGDLPPEKSVVPDNLSSKENWAFRPSIIFVMLESFRADLVGSRLSGKEVTPVINSLAKSGVSSSSAYSHNGYTSQSRYHSLSGAFPGRRKSIIHDFRKNGYFVAYFSAQDVSFGGNDLGVGFDDADISYDARVEPGLRFNTFSTPGSISLSNQVIKKKVLDYLRSYDKDKPVFLYINFQDTHFPYRNGDVMPLLNDIKLSRSSILPEKKDELLLMYKNTAANIDLAIGEILKEAKRVLGEDLAVVILSDHGESLFDDGFLGHGHMLNDHQTRIPLVISGLPVVLEEPFGQVDLRSMIGSALSRKKNSGAVPVVIKNPGKKVFQYIGNIDKPGQIGFLEQRGRFIYDFRRNLVKVWSGEWKDVSELSGRSESDFRELVHMWESIILANR